MGLQPVFVIVYESRSGSTYLADLLSRHPAISVAPESSFLRNTWRWAKLQRDDTITSPAQLEGLLRCLFDEEKLRAWDVDQELIKREIVRRLPVTAGGVARQILISFGHKHHPGSRLFGMKRGGWNALNLPAVQKLLPGVRFIHIVRDGRAVFASEKRAIHRHTGRPFQEDPTNAAWRWRQIVRSFKTAGQAGFEIRYEDLITDPQGVLAMILDSFGLDRSTETIREMLQPHSSDLVPKGREALHKGVGKPPLVERIEAWRIELENDEIRKFEKIAGDVLSEKQYELNFPTHASDQVYRVIEGIKHRVSNFSPNACLRLGFGNNKFTGIERRK